jgi:hypothetical protein
LVVFWNCGANKAKREMYIALGVMMRVMAMMLAMGHGRDRLMKGERSDDIRSLICGISHFQHRIFGILGPAPWR